MEVRVYNESCANDLISMLDFRNLCNLELICFVGNDYHKVLFDSEHCCILLTCYPFKIKIKKQSLKQSFRDAVFSIYHENFL